jgi:WD40 repeat protein
MPTSALCPPRRDLEQFAQGLLAEAAAAPIRAHLEGCGVCRSALLSMQNQATLAEPSTAVQSSPRPKGAAGPTAPVGPTGEPLDLGFLAPAQSPDEMGRLGPYRILKVLGVGGMGVVFEAEDPALQRRVALKVMLPSLAASDSGRQRFLREARAAAAIEHDHIVPIYQVGEVDGVPYLAMQLLQGETLDDRLKQCGRLPLREALRIGRELALGLAAAHRRGLIHRDVKPANVWLEARTGRVKILDFGLARTLKETDPTVPAVGVAAAPGGLSSSFLTQVGALVGTPAYMAPEQFHGKPLDHHCDLFSLGCVLYFLCTGRLPFEAPDTVSLLLAVARHDPQPPRLLDAGIPPALSALILRLLAKDPADRPESADEAAESLGAIRRFVRPPRRRRRWLVVALAAVVLALGAAVAWQLLRPKQGEPGFAPPPVPSPQELAQRAAPADDLKPENVPDEARERLDADLAGAARVAAVLGDPRWRLRGLAAFPVYAPDGKTLAIPLDKALILFDPGTGQRQRTLNGLAGRAYRTAFSPDGTLVACGDLIGNICVWDRASGRLLRAFKQPNPNLWVAGLAFGPDNRSLASGDSTGGLWIWDARAGTILQTLRGHTALVAGLAFSPDGGMLASMDNRGLVILWTPSTGLPRNQFLHEKRDLNNSISFPAVAFDRQGQRLALGSDSRVSVWDVRNQREVWAAQTPAGGFVAFTPDGQTLLTAGHDRTPERPHEVQRWDAATGKAGSLLRLETRGDWASYALSPDGRTLASSSAGGGRLRLLDAQSGKPRFPFGHSFPVRVVAVSPDGARAASADDAGVILLWGLGDGRLLARLEGHAGVVRDLAFSPDGQTLASAGHDQTVRLWDLEAARPRQLLSGHAGLVEAVAFSPDGKRLVSAGRDGAVFLWELDGDLRKRKLEGRDVSWAAAAFSPDGRTLAAAGTDGVSLWNVERGVLERTLPEEGVFRVAFLPDGAALALTMRKAVKVWSAKTGRLEQTLDADGVLSGRLSVSADGRLIAAGGDDGRVYLWDRFDAGRRGALRLGPANAAVEGLAFSPEGRHLLAAGPDFSIGVLRLSERGLVPQVPEAPPGMAEERRLEGHVGWIHTVAVVEDGKAVMTAGNDGTVRRWDFATGKLRDQTAAPPQNAGMLAFSADGKTALSGGKDGKARLWDFAAGQPLFEVSHPRAPVRLVDRSADGKYALTACDDGVVRLWTGRGGKALKELTGHEGPVRSLAVAPDGRRALSAGHDRRVRLWDLDGGVELRSFDGFPGEGGGAVCFAPDGRRAAWPEERGVVAVWDTEKGKRLLRLWPEDAASDLAFSPDGKRVLAGAWSGGLTLFDADTGRVLDRVRTPATSAVAFTPDGKHALTGHDDGKVRVWRLPDPKGR